MNEGEKHPSSFFLVRIMREMGGVAVIDVKVVVKLEEGLCWSVGLIFSLSDEESECVLLIN